VVTLEAALDAAIQTNLDYRTLEENALQAELTLQRSWAVLGPTLNADGSLTLNKQEIALAIPTGPTTAQEVVIQEKWGKRFGLTANMPIFNARSIPGIQIAQRNEAATEKSSRHLRHQILFAVASAYYQATATREIIAVSEQSLEVAQAFHKQAVALTSAGQGTSIDVSRAEIEVLDAEKALANARDAHELAIASLHYLTNLPRPFEVGSAPSRREPGELSEIEARAISGRPDLEASRLRVEMSKKYETEALLGWVPTFDVTYNWSWASAAGFAGDKDTWMLIFGARWNLFDGGHRIVDLKERRSQTRQAQYAAEALERRIRQEVETAFVNLRRNTRNVEFAARQVELAQKTHHQLTRQYEVGLSTTLDVLTASTNLANKRTNAVIEHLQRDIALLELSRAMGDYDSLRAATARP
jgi:outer membrane protein TolC